MNSSAAWCSGRGEHSLNSRCAPCCQGNRKEDQCTQDNMNTPQNSEKANSLHLCSEAVASRCTSSHQGKSLLWTMITVLSVMVFWVLRQLCFEHLHGPLLSDPRVLVKPALCLSRAE
jgi:hypothetical protein